MRGLYGPGPDDCKYVGWVDEGWVDEGNPTPRNGPGQAVACIDVGFRSSTQPTDLAFDFLL